MATKTTKRKIVQPTTAVRHAFIPDDLSYLTDTEFGREMMKPAAEIAEEQGTRTTEEINQLIDLMRGSVSTDADLILTAMFWCRPRPAQTVQSNCVL